MRVDIVSQARSLFVRTNVQRLSNCLGGGKAQPKSGVRAISSLRLFMQRGSLNDPDGPLPYDADASRVCIGHIPVAKRRRSACPDARSG